jgi:hypothetical protein
MTTAKAFPIGFAAGLLALGALACRSAGEPRSGIPMLEDAIPVAAEPVLGQPLPFQAPPQFEITLAADEKHPAYIIWVGEVLYDVAVDEKGLVSYLSTSHPSFKTPEGLHVGSSLQEARAAGAGDFAPAHGWACYAELPSGWRAGTRLGAPPEKCEPKIAWFSKGWPPPPSPQVVSLDALPAIGQPLPFQAEPSFLTLVAASQMDFAHQIQVGGIVYTVAVDKEGRVSYLSTSDPSFRTPEGLHVGNDVDEVRAAGGTDFGYEHMAGCSARLPSGWRAGAEFVALPLICRSQISWFFQRED